MIFLGKRKRKDFENNDYSYESKLEKNELLLLNKQYFEILKQIWYKEYQKGKAFLNSKIYHDIDLGNLINLDEI